MTAPGGGSSRSAEGSSCPQLNESIALPSISPTLNASGHCFNCSAIGSGTVLVPCVASLSACMTSWNRSLGLWLRFLLHGITPPEVVTYRRIVDQREPARFAQNRACANATARARILGERIRMMTQPASAIKREVCQLIDRQIEALRQPTSLSSSDLGDYHARSEKITTLYRELDRIATTSFWTSRRAS